MIDRERSQRTYGRTGHRALRTALIAAALVLVLSVTAYAVGEYTDFFAMVFGGEDAGKTTYEVPLDSWDEDGNQRTMEVTNEGEPVDQETAQGVLDGKVATSGASITVGDYTCTVEDISMADNGVGVMTYTIENENGFSSMDIADGTWGFISQGGQWLSAGDGESIVRDTPVIYPAGEGSMKTFGLDVRCSLAAHTDTKLTVAAYMILIGQDELPEALDVYFFAGDKGDYSDEYKVTVQLAEPAESVKLSADGWGAGLSPIGLMITAPEGNPYGNNYFFNDLIIHMTDGTEYAVERGEPRTVNFRVCGIDKGVTRYAFNRLIDPAQVESITAVGDAHGYMDADGQPVPYEDAWVEVESKLVGDTWTSSTDLRDGLTDMDVDLDLTFTK